MGQGIVAYPGLMEWARGGGGRSGLNYFDWLRANGYQSGEDFARAYRDNQGSMVGGQLTNPFSGQPYPMPNMGQVPGPGLGGGPQSPPPTANPPTLNQIPSMPAYAPPQVQMPMLLSNPTPQGLGGMPMVRDRMFGSVLAPFAQANWGVPQVDPRYLTQQVPLQGGATPASMMVMNAPPTGLGGAVGPPNMGTPRVPSKDPRVFI